MAGTTCGQVDDLRGGDIVTCGAASYYNGEDMAWSFNFHQQVEM
ncbi:MAG: hypothetical protein R2847_08750 [Bacteroidia bacterium]